jgi:hypothetical protein
MLLYIPMQLERERESYKCGSMNAWGLAKKIELDR